MDTPLGLREIKAPRIYRKSVNGFGKVVSPTHRPPLPPGDIPYTHFYCKLRRLQGRKNSVNEKFQ